MQQGFLGTAFSLHAGRELLEKAAVDPSARMDAVEVLKTWTKALLGLARPETYEAWLNATELIRVIETGEQGDAVTGRLYSLFRRLQAIESPVVDSPDT